MDAKYYINIRIKIYKNWYHRDTTKFLQSSADTMDDTFAMIKF